MGNVITVLITGVGMTSTAFFLGRYLSGDFELCINVGVCGCFTDRLELGRVVQIERDCFADLGAEDDLHFLPGSKLNLPAPFQVTIEKTWESQFLFGIEKVVGATVNTAHGNSESILRFMTQSDAEVESMEGAAFIWSCNQFNLPCIQLRAVSNKIEKRDFSRWKLPLAIENVNKVLLGLLETLRK